MALVKVADLTPEHQGVQVVLQGHWPVPGSLHFNKRAKTWELSIPRPHRKDGRPQRLWLSYRDDVVEIP